MTTFSIACPASSEHLKGPVIANFPNGPLNPEKANSVTVVEYEKERGRAKSTVLVAETDKMDFIGTATDNNSEPVYCVARVNRKTGKIYIYDAVRYNLQPQIGSSAGDVTEEKEEKTMSEKMDKLTEAFGTNKKRRNMETRRRNKLQDESVEKVVKFAISGTLSNLPADQPSLMSRHQALSMPDIPPCNVDATRPEDAYRLDDLISAENMSDLTPLAKELADADKSSMDTWAKEERFPPYVLDQLRNLPLNEELRLQRCCSLLYLNCLISLYQAQAKNLREGNFLPKDTPVTVVKRLKTDFMMTVPRPTGKGKHMLCMPTRLKDKVISYLIVLAMIIDEFNVNMDLLYLSLKLNLRLLINHIRAVGGKMNISTVAGTSISRATLPIPITFPELSKKKPKSRGR